MSTLPNFLLTPEEYLAIERAADGKSEYYRGQMFAMSGTSTRHNDIAVQLAFLLKQHLRGGKCHIQVSDVRVHVAAIGLYTYPDLVVTCGERQYIDAQFDTLTNPTLLVEVLSPTTERYDRVFKVPSYRTIPSLRECLLIAQFEPHVQKHSRLPDGNWSIVEARGLAAALELTSINYTLRLDELYETALPPD